MPLLPRVSDQPRFTVAVVTNPSALGDAGPIRPLATASLAQEKPLTLIFNVREVEEGSGRPLEAVRGYQRAQELQPRNRSVLLHYAAEPKGTGPAPPNTRNDSRRTPAGRGTRAPRNPAIGLYAAGPKHIFSSAPIVLCSPLTSAPPSLLLLRACCPQAGELRNLLFPRRPKSNRPARTPTGRLRRVFRREL